MNEHSQRLSSEARIFLPRSKSLKYLKYTITAFYSMNGSDSEKRHSRTWREIVIPQSSMLRHTPALSRWTWNLKNNKYSSRPNIMKTNTITKPAMYTPSWLLTGCYVRLYLAIGLIPWWTMNCQGWLRANVSLPHHLSTCSWWMSFSAVR